MADVERQETRSTIPGLRPPDKLCFGANPKENWNLFLQRWETYTTLANINAQPQKLRVALFLHLLDDDALRTYNSFQFTTPPEERKVAEIIEMFEKYAIGEVNETYERFVFNKRRQEEGETFDNFYSDLRRKIKTCNFCENCCESIMRDKIILGIRCSETQTELLKKRNLTLDSCVDVCKAAESAVTQNRAMRTSREEVTVNKITRFNRGNSNSASKGRQCRYCSGNHPFTSKELCPAYGKICSKCGGKNHFAKACKSGKRVSRNHGQKKVRTVNEEEEEDENDWIYSVDSADNREVKCRMQLDNRDATFLIDTGATVNILPQTMIKNEMIRPTRTSLSQYNGDKLETVGTTTLELVNPKTKTGEMTDFIVCKGNCQAFMGLKTATRFGLIEVKEDKFERVRVMNQKKECILQEFKEVFDDEKVGCLPGIQKLKVNPGIQPVIQPSRRIPIAIKPKLRIELDRMERMGIIKKVDKPTPWVNQVVVSPKRNGELRICLDPRELNKALQREHYTIPVLEDVLHQLSDSSVFSKLDLKSGYWHIALDEDASFLTTFQTCFGRYRYMRLPFGLNVSAEVFQKKVLEVFGDMPGVICIHDDIIVHGKSEDEHNKHLKQVLQRCYNYEVKLNAGKFDYAKSEINFMGHIISKDGIKTDPEKVKAISEYPTPKCLEELRRFLGMVNYVARYMPSLSHVLHPLHNLMRKDTQWTWSETQEEAFQCVKKLVSDSPLLAYYDPNKELTLENDASEYGLGSALLQDGQPIAFASRSLSQSEKNYAQIEKELLAVVYGLQKFHHYTYGRNVTVITDHKPLVAISNKPLHKAPKRLQSLLLKAQTYNFDIQYKPGKQIPISDALSRAPVSKPDPPILEEVCNLSLTPIPDHRLDDIRGATVKDETMQRLSKIITTGWPSDKNNLPAEVLPYYSYRDELTAQDGIILRGDRVVIPKSLRLDMKGKVHAGHPGINACLRRARQLIFWPGMSNDIRSYVETCDTCATHSVKQPQQPLQLHAVPNRPWEKIGIDLFKFNGRNYLMTIDYFSNFFEIDYLHETTSKEVIYKLKHHFSRHGIPDVVISDNGPQFASHEFRDFSKKWIFTHETISPGNSQANGLAEAGVKTAKSIMTKCLKSKEDPFLGFLNYRNTPSEGLETSPTQRLLGRQTKTLLPITRTALQQRTTVSNSFQKKKECRKFQTAERFIHRRSLPPLHVGDNVRMQPIDDGKEWKEATITKQLRRGSYEVSDGKRTYRRSRTFLRLKPPSRQTE